MIGFRFVLSPSRSSSQLMTVFTSALGDRLLKRPRQHLHSLAVADPHGVAHERAGRRSAGDAAVGVIHPAMARTQEKLGACAPVHGAAEVGAVEPEGREITLASAPQPHGGT